MATLEELKRGALGLPRSDRWRILRSLLDSLATDPETDSAWLEETRTWMETRRVQEEADERFQAYLAGELQAVPAKEAIAELLQSIVVVHEGFTA